MLINGIKTYERQAKHLTPIALVIQEAEFGRIVVLGLLGQKVKEIPPQPIN
jgi:hypothetical protein